MCFFLCLPTEIQGVIRSKRSRSNKFLTGIIRTYQSKKFTGIALTALIGAKGIFLMALFYVTDENTKFITTDDSGRPMVDDDATEDAAFALDGLHLYSQIPTLNNECKALRIKQEESDKRIAEYEKVVGKDEDALKRTKEALVKVKTFGEKEMIESGEVEKLKETLLKVESDKYNELQVQMQAMIDERDVTIGIMQKDIYGATVRNKFQQCGYFNGEDKKSTLDAEVAEAYFSKNFKVEKQNDLTVVVGYDDKGTKIYSKSKGGQPADFDECIAYLIENSGKKETLLYPSSGGSAPGGGGPGKINKGNAGMTAEQLQKMDPGARLTMLRRESTTEQGG